MPTKKRGFLYLISINYEVRPQNKSRVCKELLIFMVNGTPINGKDLHTYEDLIYGLSVGVFMPD